jgi:hypothetical protein
MLETNRQPVESAQTGHAKGADHVKRATQKSPIDWDQWWPFTRATGAALKQLNRRQPAPAMCLDLEEAPY